MKTISVSVTPVAKQRPRGYKTKNGKIGFYTPSSNKEFEYIIRKQAEKVFEKPLTTPVSLTIFFYMPRPKRLIWKTKPMPSHPCDKRPDIDNLIKSVTDGLNGIAYLDDGQISSIHAYKRYHAGDGRPKTVIKIEKDEMKEEEKKWES